MSATEIFRVGADRLLCDAWHAPSRTVMIRPADPRRRPSPTAIRSVLETMSGRGFERVLTAALDDALLDPFAASGFELHEELRVLRHDLDQRPVADGPGRSRFPARRGRGSSGPAIRRGSPRRDDASAAVLDERAFARGHALDAGGLDAIRTATPLCRFRLADAGTPARPAAYLLSGLGAGTGYVQRLAVDPAWQRRGLARTLLGDALAWFHRRKVGSVLVNTQVSNLAAQELYQAMGFVPAAGRLTVLSWHRPGSSHDRSIRIGSA